MSRLATIPVGFVPQAGGGGLDRLRKCGRMSKNAEERRKYLREWHLCGFRGMERHPNRSNDDQKVMIDHQIVMTSHQKVMTDHQKVVVVLSLLMDGLSK